MIWKIERQSVSRWPLSSYWEFWLVNQQTKWSRKLFRGAARGCICIDRETTCHGHHIPITVPGWAHNRVWSSTMAGIQKLKFVWHWMLIYPGVHRIQHQKMEAPRNHLHLPQTTIWTTVPMLLSIIWTVSEHFRLTSNHILPRRNGSPHRSSRWFKLMTTSVTTSLAWE